ncbi:MAG: DUF4326 domain-containing protein [Ardenticatenaceae bacterium]|nr:DUF4326 domain-containing protein [Ardenticatenaceae bacterium]
MSKKYFEVCEEEIYFTEERINEYRREQMCVNIKDFKSVDGLNASFKSWVYIGRGDSRLNLKRSPLANPYSHLANANAIKCATRDEAISKYRVWLWNKIKAGDKEVILALLDIKPSTAVVCHCHPKPCHGSVVKAAAKWLQSQVVAI